MRIFVMFVLLLFTTSACNQEDPFERSMRAGKDALLNKDYEEAVRQFDIALIENPSNNDAITLYNRANNSLKEKLEIERMEKEEKEARRLIILYEEQLSEFVRELVDFEESLNNQELTVEVATSRLDDISAYQKKLNSLRGEWENNNKIMLIHNELVTAIMAMDSSMNSFLKDQHSKYNNLRISIAAFKLEKWFEGVEQLKNN